MKNYVEFVDGHKEDILDFVDYGDEIVFKTPRGKYAFRTWIEELENGIKCTNWCFLNAATGCITEDICHLTIEVPRFDV